MFHTDLRLQKRDLLAVWLKIGATIICEVKLVSNEIESNCVRDIIQRKNQVHFRGEK